MLLKYNCEINNQAIINHLKKLTNQIYKLLPSREEGSDWGKPLATIIEEFVGMDRLLSDQHTILFSILCKLEGLYNLTQPDDFGLYRKTIFECLSLVQELSSKCLD